MQTPRRISLIVLLLLALIFGPAVIVGYTDLARAQAGATAAESSRYYEAAAQRLPWQPGLYAAAGVAALDAREYGRAIALFQTARRQGSLAPAGQLQLGRAYLLAGQNDNAILEWKALLGDAQVRQSASDDLASVYHGLGRFDEEQQVLQGWLRFEPANADAQYRLGRLLFAQASPDALPVLAVVTARGPAALKAHVAGLVSTLKLALAQPTHAQGLLICGRALASVGEWRLAASSFRAATRADPSNGLAWAWLGEASQQTGSPAAGLFERALAEAPASAEVHAMAGLYWQRQQNWQRALVEFGAASRLEPHNEVWQMSLGDVYTQLGDLVKALACYQAATQLSPADPQTWAALALFSVENSVDVEGVGRDAALQAYALQPDSAQNLDTLGRVMMDTAQWGSAEVFLKKAVAAAPDQAAPYFHLGLLYLQTDRPDLARQFLQAARLLDGDGPIGTQAAAALARYLP